MKKEKDWVIPENAIKIPLPDTLQSEDYTCGGVALKAILEYYGAGSFTEKQMEKELHMAKDGTDPFQLVEVIEKYKLCYLEYRPMTSYQLIDFLNKQKPVMIMLQAWGYLPSYSDVWDNGHWVIAIGYDTKGFYFEDPSSSRKRGYLLFEDLEQRWHDIEGHDEHQVEHYGLVVWGNKIVNPNYKIKKANYIP